MAFLSFFRLDLGLVKLLPEWKRVFKGEYLQQDFFAGVTLALVALPLSLAIALASGVEPITALISAIIAGVVCSLFGGNELAVSGPSAAMTVLLSMAMAQYGLSGLVLIGLICGILQIITGVFRLGRFVRLMPIPVIEGFIAGIGAIILIGQLPRALGLPVPDESHVIDVVTHIGALIHESQTSAVLVAAFVMVLFWLIPKLNSRLPAALIALTLPSLAGVYFSDNLTLIGKIPRTIPFPALPTWPEHLDFFALFATALLVYALASLETLLCSTAVDKLVRGQKSDLDQDLIGQGLGNLIISFFGGMPVTGVISRSATSVMSGAKTRLTSIFSSIIILVTVLIFAPLMSKIPIAALAGLLLSVALRMMSVEKLLNLWRLSKADAAIYCVTFSVIVFVDLLQGVQWGLVAALLMIAVQLGRTKSKLFGLNQQGPYRFEWEGPVTFLSTLKVDRLKKELLSLDVNRGVLIDMRKVTDMDGSGGELFVELIEDLRGHGFQVGVFGLSEKKRHLLVSADKSGEMPFLIADTEQELLKIFRNYSLVDESTRLEHGVSRYLNQERHRYKDLFEKLADEQTPHTLLITCCDSRLQPSLITSTDPGELFIIRNIGNMAPVFEENKSFSESAGIDFAVGILNVKEIVVCGHSGCGAMKVLHEGLGLPGALKSLKTWRFSTASSQTYKALPSEIELDKAARMNSLHQLDNLRSYPIVRQRESVGELKLSAWFFEIKSGEVEIWSSKEKEFIKQSELNSLEKPV